MVPVSVGFWYQPHVTFIPKFTLTFKPKKTKLPSLLSSSMMNSKLGCNLMAASRITPGSPLTFLNKSSTYLRQTSTSFSVRSKIVYCISCNTLLYQRCLRIRIPICYHTLGSNNSNKFSILPL